MTTKAKRMAVLKSVLLADTAEKIKNQKWILHNILKKDNIIETKKDKRISLLDNITDAESKRKVQSLEEELIQDCKNFYKNRDMKSWMVVSIDGRDDARLVSQTAKAVTHCYNIMRDIRPFQKAVLFCYQKPKGYWPIEMIRIPKINIVGYSSWCIKELWKYVTTDFVLMVQHDGYIINPKSWSEEFLDYDYIGAPWPHFLTYDGNVGVGNGGFSIRSRQLCEQVAFCQLPHMGINEDVYICQTMRKEKAYNADIKFAPPSVAARFAVESIVRQHQEQNIDDNTVFGFHMFGGPRRQPLK